MRSPEFCDRCKNKMGISTIMSWFTNEIICSNCSDEERNMRSKLPNNGIEFEGCGFVPDAILLDINDKNCYFPPIKLKEE